MALILLAIGLVALAQPFWLARARRAWPVAQARVIEIPQRRTMFSATWAVTVEFTPAGHAPVRAAAPINIVRTPIAAGETVAIMHHPTSPSRTAMTPLEGASTGWMVAGLCFLGALGLAGGL